MYRLSLVAVLLAIVAVLLLAVIPDGGFSTYRVDSSSMEPTLHCAAGPGCLQLRPDEVLVSKFIYDVSSVNRGDIIVFHTPGEASRDWRSILLIKRVVAVGGDKIAENRGRIFVNNRLLSEPYIRPNYRDHRSFKTVRVPSGTYFVLGDNRERSRDSRDFGPVRRSAIIGKAIAILSPFSRLGAL
jgi:signal peptidase I